MSKLKMYYDCWKLSQYGKIGKVRYFDFFPFFEISWSVNHLSLHTKGNVNEDCEPSYDKVRTIGKAIY